MNLDAIFQTFLHSTTTLSINYILKKIKVISFRCILKTLTKIGILHLYLPIVILFVIFRSKLLN